MKLKKQLLMAMGTMAIAAMLISAGTFALFTAEATNEGNTFATGTLTIEDITNGDGSSAINISDIAPGDSGSATLTIENTGTLDAWVKLSDATTDGALFEGSHPVELDYSDDAVRINAGDSADFDVTWNFPLDAGNEYQGEDGEAIFNFDAVQYNNNSDASNIDWGN